jgi:hypothetical protein
MKAVYKDQNITLFNMRMAQFDPSHDMPTLIQNLAKSPSLLDIQDRTLIARTIALLMARKDLPTTVLIGASELTVLTAMLVYLFGNASPKRRLLSVPTASGVADNGLAADLLVQLTSDNVADDMQTLVERASGRSDFLIAVMPSSSKDDVRSVIDLLTADRSGVLLVKNYGHISQSSHHEYCRDRGLRMVQLPDGSGELFNLAF